jgi:hypothetical protein
MGMISFYAILGIIGLISLIVIIIMVKSWVKEIRDLAQFRETLLPGDVIRVQGRPGIHLMYKDLCDGRIVIQENGTERFPTVHLCDVYPVPESNVEWEITTSHD